MFVCILLADLHNEDDVPRFRDWGDFTSRHPSEAAFLDSESAKQSRFLSAMRELIEGRKVLSVKQMRAISDAAERARTGVKSPSRGDRVRRTFFVCGLGRGDDDHGAPKTYTFKRVSEGWGGRIVCDSPSLAAEFAQRGYVHPDMHSPAPVLVEPAVEVFFDARVARKSPDGAFLIFEDVREVRVDGEAVNHRTQKQEERRQKIAERPRASWRDALKL